MTGSRLHKLGDSRTYQIIDGLQLPPCMHAHWNLSKEPGAHILQGTPVNRAGVGGGAELGEEFQVKTF